LAERAFASIRWRSGLDADLVGLRSRVELDALRSRTETEELRSRIEAGELKSRGEAAELRAKIDELEHKTDVATLWAEITFRSEWSVLAPLIAEPTISVVLATRNRSPLLRRAIQSVLAQTYPRWELIVVNDASTDDTPSVIEAVNDERVRMIDSDGSGASRALNLGLREASGSIVAFLDDDNLMAPGWLRAATVAFQEQPDLNAVYGAQLRSREAGSPGEASLLFVSPFDWERLIEGNFIDLGAVAHRHKLEGLSFDEELRRLNDWDYVVALAGRFGIEPLPVVASFYTTTAPSRMTHGSGSVEAEVADLRRRFRDAFGPSLASQS
jgi:Glycosyl transferase family 2